MKVHIALRDRAQFPIIPLEGKLDLVSKTTQFSGPKKDPRWRALFFAQIALYSAEHDKVYSLLDLITWLFPIRFFIFLYVSYRAFAIGTKHIKID